MPGIGAILVWIVMGGVVGWVVSLLVGHRFQGGPVVYVLVGIVAMAALGLVLTLLKLVWLLFMVAVVVVAIAAVVRVIGGM